MKITKADVLPLTLVIIAAVIGLGLSVTRPFLAPDEEPIFTFENAQQEKLFALVQGEFGLFTAPTMSDDWLPEGAGDLLTGRGVYQVQCIHCHGSEGGAETYTARMLNPPPRNFSLGAVVRTSTPPGHPPLRDDIRMLVKDGIPNTSMSSFAGLSDADRFAVSDYVMYLLIRGAVWNQALVQLNQLSPDAAFEAALGEQKARWSHPEAK